MFTLPNVLLFVTPLLFSAVAMAALHWFPWHRGAAELSRLGAYTAGTMVVVGVPAAAMIVAHFAGLDVPAVTWAGLLLANAAVSGITVQLAYWYDNRLAITSDDVHHARRRE